MMLYKYRGCGQRTWEVLINRKLYFATAAQLNDPLDSSIDIVGEYERAKQIAAQSEDHPDGRKSFLLWLLDTRTFTDRHTKKKLTLNQLMQRFLADVGILSFSKSPTDALLWSHYSEGHRGICLAFDSELLNLPNVYIKGNVSYVEEPPYAKLFLELSEKLGEFVRPWEEDAEGDDEEYERKADDFYARQLSLLARANLLVKSKKWEYEQEYRYVKVEPGGHPFDPRALREVICGTKVSATDQETLANLLRHPDFAHVAVSQVRNVEGSFDFSIAPPAASKEAQPEGDPELPKPGAQG